MKTTKYIILLLLAVNLVSCQKKETAAVVSNNAILVSTTRATLSSYQTSLQYGGNIVASKAANLGASLPGKIEKINYNEGDFVKKGAVVAELSGELLTQAQIENDAIRKDYERVERLLQKKSVTQQDYDHIKAKLEASDAKVSQLKKATRVVAPFSGYVTDKLMEEGEIFFINIPLDPGYSHASGILRLMKFDPVNVEIEVNESELPLLKEGMPVTLTSGTYLDKVFEGKISNIKMMLATTTRTSTVTVEVSNRELMLKPGMFVRVTVPQKEMSGVKVPLNAIYRQTGTADDYLFVVEPDNTVAKIEIERVETLGDSVVVSVLSGDEVIVTTGKNKLVNGSKIRVNQ